MYAEKDNGTDPLHAYRGADRDLRDEIERVLINGCMPAASILPKDGTLRLANQIMEAVKRHGR